MYTRHKRFIAILLALAVMLNYTVTVLADVGGDVDNALKGADAYTAIKYVLTQMGAIFAGSLDDVIKNNQTLLGYADNGLPVEKDSKGNINIKNEVVNNIYNAVKDTATALDGYYLVTPVGTFEDFFFNLPAGYPLSAYATLKAHVDSRDGFVLMSGIANIYTPGPYTSVEVSGYPCMSGNYVTFCNYSLDYIGYQNYSINYDGSLVPKVGFQLTLEQFKQCYIGAGATKVFYSVQDLRKYLGGYNNVYYRSNFYNYNVNNDNRMTFNGDKVLTQNWDTINNNIVNNIRNEIVGKDLNEDDRQTAIDGVADEILGALGDIGGGIDNVNNNLNSWLSRIYKLLGVVSNNLVSSIRQLSDILDNIEKIPAVIKDSFDNLGKALDLHFSALIKAIESIETGGGGSSFWDLLKKLLAGLIGGTVASVIGGLFSDIIDKFLAGVLSLEEMVKAITGVLGDLNLKFKPVVTASKTKFPVSLPWDFIAVVMMFRAEPETPKFEIPLDLDSYNIHEKIVIDLKQFSNLSKASRSMLTVSFLLILILLTLKFMKGIMDT